MSALDWMLKAYPEVKEREDMRRIIGRYGLTGTQQVLLRCTVCGDYFVNVMSCHVTAYCSFSD